MTRGYGNLPARPDTHPDMYRPSRYDSEYIDPQDHRRPDFHRRSESDSFRYRPSRQDESPPRMYDLPRGPRIDSYRDRPATAHSSSNFPQRPSRPARSPDRLGPRPPKKQKPAPKLPPVLTGNTSGARRSPDDSPASESSATPGRSLASRITMPSPASETAASSGIPAPNAPCTSKSGSPLTETCASASASNSSSGSAATNSATSAATATPNSSTATPSTAHPDLPSPSMQNSGEPPTKRRRELFPNVIAGNASNAVTAVAPLATDTAATAATAITTTTTTTTSSTNTSPKSKDSIILECDIALSSVADYIRACLHQGQVRKLLDKANQELEKHVSRHPEIRAQAELPRHRIAVLEKQLAEAETSVKKFRCVTEDVVSALIRHLQQASGSEKTSSLVAKLEAKLEQQASMLSQQEKQIKSLETRDKMRGDMVTRLAARLSALENDKEKEKSASSSSGAANHTPKLNSEPIKSEVSALRSFQSDLATMKLVTTRIEAKFGVVSKRSEADTIRISRLARDIENLTEAAAKAKRDYNGGDDRRPSGRVDDEVLSLKKNFAAYKLDQEKTIGSLKRDYTDVMVKLARIQTSYAAMADNLSQQTLGLEMAREDISKLQADSKRLSESLDDLKSLTTSDEARHSDRLDNLKTDLETASKTLTELSAKLNALSSSNAVGEGAAATAVAVGDEGAEATQMEQSHLKTLKLVVKKMKKLEETQDFVVSSWGAQLDDLRQELPAIIAENLAQNPQANASASEPAPVPVPVAAPVVSGPSNKEVADEVTALKTQIESTKVKLEASEKRIAAMSQLLETVQAQFRAIRTDDMYDSIVEHLELWHPTSTRSVLDELRAKLEDYETRLQMVMPGGQDSSDEPLAKKRRIDGTVEVS